MSAPHEAIKARIAEIGAQFDPEVLAMTQALYAPLIAPPSREVETEFDLAYGADPRQKLDIYRPRGASGMATLIFVPGGGFVGGDKRGSELFYANLGRWFAKRGFVVVAINYRLAPAHAWPAGAEDVRDAAKWTFAHIGAHGGDAENMFLFGQSAGATHVATYLTHPRLQADKSRVRGVILTSGFYRATPENRAPNIVGYFGSDPAELADRSPLTHAGAGFPPLLLSVAEYDPGFLAAPTFELAAAIARVSGKAPETVWLKGHNHVSTVLGLDSGDDVFGNTIVAFMNETLARR